MNPNESQERLDAIREIIMHQDWIERHELQLHSAIRRAHQHGVPIARIARIMKLNYKTVLRRYFKESGEPIQQHPYKTNRMKGK